MKNYTKGSLNALVRQGTIGLIALLLWGLTPGQLQAQEVYQALLRGRHESFPVATPAHGMVSATLDGNVLTVEGQFSGLLGDYAANIAGGSHIHLGYAGQAGGIELPLSPVLDQDLHGGAYLPEDNTFTLTDAQLAALNDRQLYVNIHSSVSLGGELRGQLLPAAEQYFYTNLLGSNEVPAIMSGGRGALAFELNGSTLTVSGSFQNLEGDFATQAAGGAHLHMGFAGENGNIEIPLHATAGEDGRSGVFLAADNTFELTLAQSRALQYRLLYANIHSRRFLGGELRGQVVGMARSVFRTHLSGSNEMPAVTGMATGVILAELMADDRLVISGSFGNLESKMAINISGGAHLHLGLAGSNGPVMYRLFTSPKGDLRSGVFWPYRNVINLAEAEVEALYQRAFYADIHTIRNGDGEIRGQLLPESQIVFNGFLSSIFQTGGQLSTASGGIKAELTGNKLVVSGSFSGLSSEVATDIAGGAHIHRGMAGTNGPVTQPLNITFYEGDLTEGIFEAAGNTFELSVGDINELKDRNKYVNIHSQNFRPGEIRSQLLPEATTYFVAPLSGSSQTAIVNSQAVGMTIMEVTGNIGITSGSFNNLSGPLATFIAGGAHVHSALAGENAPVTFPLNSSLSADQLSGVFPAADNVQSLNPGLMEDIRSRSTYVNVHSDRYRPGEIRGQLLPLATAYFTASLSGGNSVQPKATEAKGQVKAELHGDELVLSGAFAGLTGDFAVAVAGGSHLHGAPAGTNGPIQVSTHAALDADLKGGRFLAEDNTFDLDAATLDLLVDGGLYLNLHSTTFMPGEIRGQLLGEINAFPSSEAAIQSPALGTALTLEGDPAAPFEVQWSEASDRDQLAYIWQLSTGIAFANLLVNQNVGSALSFSTDFASLDNLLAAQGVAIGETVNLFHRAVASDGSLATVGPTSFIRLTRGMLDDNNRQGIFVAGQLKATTYRVFPTVVPPTHPVTVQVSSAADQPAKLVLVNSMGQALQSRDIDLFAGDNQLDWSLPDLPAGFYFIQLQNRERLLPLQRIIVQGGER